MRITVHERGHEHTAVSASAGNPLYSHSVSDLETRRLCSGSQLDDFSNTFVAADLAWLSWKWKYTPLFLTMSLYHRLQWLVHYVCAKDARTEFIMTPKSE